VEGLNAGIWEQQNRHVTAADGYYSFFTLPGKKKVVAALPGYWLYESPILTVVDELVHRSIGPKRLGTVYPLLVFGNL